jgi:predicted  nucleic acid-binding Zn-ribbon protein
MYDAHYYDYEDSGFKELMGTEFDEVEYQENIVLDSRAKALALHQNVPVFLIKNEYGDYYTDMSSDEEYLILTDSEADREAESRAESYLDEGGLSSVNSDYLTTDWVHIKQICEDDANEYVRNNMDEEEQVEAAGKKDDYDDLTYDIDEMESEMIDIEEEVGVLNDDIESLIDGFKDEYKEYLQLKNRLDSGAFSDEDEKEDLLDDIQWKVDNLDSLKKEVVEYRNEKIKLYKRYRDLKYDIKVLKSELEDLLSDIEDEAVEKYAQDRFDDIEYSGAIKWFWDNYGWETKQLIENGILDLDKEEYFETVRNERATWLAPYDHDENYETVGDETYYIFRHN